MLLSRFSPSLAFSVFTMMCLGIYDFLNLVLILYLLFQFPCRRTSLVRKQSLHRWPPIQTTPAARLSPSPGGRWEAEAWNACSTGLQQQSLKTETCSLPPALLVPPPLSAIQTPGMASPAQPPPMAQPPAGLEVHRLSEAVL